MVATRTLADALLQPAIYLGQVTNNCQAPTNFNASFKQCQQRSPHFFRTSIKAGTRTRIIFPNFYLSSSSPYEASPGATATIKAALEYPADTFTQLTFSGSATGTIPDGGILACDDFSLPVTIPAGAKVWIRSLFTNSAGIVYTARGSSSGDQSAGLQELGATTSSLTDKTMGGTISAAGTNPYVPFVFACDHRDVSWLCVGDSRAVGQGETTGNMSLDYGVLAGSLGPIFPTSVYAVSGGTMNASSGQRANMLAAAPYFSHCVNELGYNDRGSGSSAILTKWQSLYTMLKGANTNLKLYQTTLAPGTTSTVAISSLTSSSTVATAVIPAQYGQRLQVGQQIIVAGATPSGYNANAASNTVVSGITYSGTDASVTYTLPSGGSGLASASPTGTLSDIWASRIFQTPVANVQDLVDCNTALRTGQVAQVTGYFDYADMVEIYRNAGILRFPGYYGDGVHETAFALQQLKASTFITGQKFTR